MITASAIVDGEKLAELTASQRMTIVVSETGDFPAVSLAIGWQGNGELQWMFATVDDEGINDIAQGVLTSEET